jgi:hypothetical protein
VCVSDTGDFFISLQRRRLPLKSGTSSVEIGYSAGPKGSRQNKVIASCAGFVRDYLEGEGYAKKLFTSFE